MPFIVIGILAVVGLLTLNALSLRAVLGKLETIYQYQQLVGDLVDRVSAVQCRELLHRLDALSLLNTIRDNSVYTKNFCEEYSWRLVHFTDEELAELAQGEMLRQERIERESHPIERTGGNSQPGRLSNPEPVPLVCEPFRREDLRYDPFGEVPHWRPGVPA